MSISLNEKKENYQIQGFPGFTKFSKKSIKKFKSIERERSFKNVFLTVALPRDILYL